MNIGEAVRLRILALCDENHINVNKLCAMSGVTQSTVNNIVNGRNKSTTISTIKKLCDGLEITIPEFFNWAALHKAVMPEKGVYSRHSALKMLEIHKVFLRFLP